MENKKQSNYSITFKFIILNLVFLSPLFVPLFFMLREMNQDIKFTDRELAGQEILDPLNKLYAINTKILTYSYYRVNLNDNDEDSQLISHGDEAMLSLEKALNKYPYMNSENKLNFNELTKTWKDLQAASSHTEKVNAAHTLSKNIEEYIHVISNSSNLILDPDLTTYHLINVIYYSNPNLLGHLGDLELATNSSQNNSATQKKFYSSISFLLTDVEQIVESLGISIKENSTHSRPNDRLQKQVQSKYEALQASIVSLGQDLHLEANQEKTEPIWKNFIEVINNQQMLTEEGRQSINELLLDRINDVQSKRQNSLLMILFITACATILSLFIQRSITQPIKAVMTSLDKISNETSSASVKLSQSSQQTATSTIESSAAIQESVSAMSEMSSMISHTAQNIYNTNEITHEVLSLTSRGDSTMQSLGHSMDNIALSNRKLTEITRIIESISEKTMVINEIAFKTQLLAVNAAIEAARAGQHGIGFTVVASEVGTLADMSGTAASDIRKLLNDSKAKVFSIIDQSSASIAEGQKVCDGAQQVFDQISQKIDDICKKIDQVQTATKEQELGVKQTSVALTQLNATTQNNSQMAQENMRNANHLKRLGLDLIKIGEDLNSLVLGGHADHIHRTLISAPLSKTINTNELNQPEAKQSL